MGNWQERLKQVLNAESEKEQRAAREVLKREQEFKDIQARELDTKNTEENLAKQELLVLVNKLEIREALEAIRDEVWKEGTINEKVEIAHVNQGHNDWHLDEYEIGLSFTYLGLYHHSGNSGEMGGESGGSASTYDNGWKRSWLKTRTIVALERRFIAPEGSTSLEYRRSFNGQPYGYQHVLIVYGVILTSSIELDPNSPEKSKGELDELLLRDCVERTKTGNLPLQLEAEGKEMIRKNTPWFKRLLNT